jgi:Asp-tRNA(Asn)/Glu-tRNA(Gln) amidotransferase A subunit family amidase
MSANPNFPVEEATIADAHTAMNQGHLTALALVDAYLVRIDAYDQQRPTINSLVNFDNTAQTYSDELDTSFAASGEFSGLLHGSQSSSKTVSKRRVRLRRRVRLGWPKIDLQPVRR